MFAAQNMLQGLLALGTSFNGSGASQAAILGDTQPYSVPGTCRASRSPLLEDKSSERASRGTCW